MSARYAEGRSARAPAELKPFQLRGRFLTALALRIETHGASSAFFEALDSQLQATPQFFAGAPFVIDLSRAPDLADLARLRPIVTGLRRRKLLVFGVQSPGALDAEALADLGLIPVQDGRDAPSPGRSDRGGRVDKLVPPDNKLVTTPVRSGQMIVAERGDLTILGSVASGAEVIAAGNIHVYGSLRGRAMAGAHGDAKARIFCQRLDAELVAIAGLYQTSDTLDGAPRDAGVQIYLEDERLRMEALG